MEVRGKLRGDVTELWRRSFDLDCT